MAPVHLHSSPFSAHLLSCLSPMAPVQLHSTFSRPPPFTFSNAPFFLLSLQPLSSPASLFHSAPTNSKLAPMPSPDVDEMAEQWFCSAGQSAALMLQPATSAFCFPVLPASLPLHSAHSPPCHRPMLTRWQSSSGSAGQRAAASLIISPSLCFVPFLLPTPFSSFHPMPSPDVDEMAEQWFCGAECCADAAAHAQQVATSLHLRCSLSPSSCLLSHTSLALLSSRPKSTKSTEKSPLDPNQPCSDEAGQLSQPSQGESMTGRQQAEEHEAEGYETEGYETEGHAVEGYETERQLLVPNLVPEGGPWEEEVCGGCGTVVGAKGGGRDRGSNTEAVETWTNGEEGGRAGVEGGGERGWEGGEERGVLGPGGSGGVRPGLAGQGGVKARRIDCVEHLPSPSLSTCFSSLLSAHLATPSAPNRLVLRSVCSHKPVLLLVLLSAHTAVGWGVCGDAGKGGHEGEGKEEEWKKEDAEEEERKEEKGKEGGLRRVVKLMCKAVDSDSGATREADEWGARGHAEDVYVMPVTALELQGCLNENSLSLPPTCREFNGFTVSFLQV
ncbi:unnamed protein product [Closterium sp. Naga37s-1]|nr:unnamed protein product [Closterium sp. Naga37s-1]